MNEKQSTTVGQVAPLVAIIALIDLGQREGSAWLIAAGVLLAAAVARDAVESLRRWNAERRLAHAG